MLIRTPPGAALRSEADADAGLRASFAASASGLATSRKRKLPPPLRTLRMPRRAADQSRQPLAIRLDPADPLLVDRPARRRQGGERRGDAGTGQRIRRQRPRRHRDQLGIADRRADPRAGEAIGLGQGAQHDQVRPSGRLGGEALRLGELDIGLVEDDDRLGQRLGDAEHLRPDR